MSKILVVEDESVIASTIKYNLVREGYVVLTCGDGKQGLQIARLEKPDLLILDLMLPSMSGLDVCRAIRRESNIPILILTAREAEMDRVLGLELGADDYITKPFSVRELIARVRASLRRVEMQQDQSQVPLDHSSTNKSGVPASGAKADNFEAGDLSVDLTSHLVVKGGKEIVLKPKEFELLVFLLRHRGQVLSRDAILQNVWGYEYSGANRTVDVHVHGLRTKLEGDPENPIYIQTIFGFGYKFSA